MHMQQHRCGFTPARGRFRPDAFAESKLVYGVRSGLGVDLRQRRENLDLMRLWMAAFNVLVCQVRARGEFTLSADFVEKLLLI
ncbi:hypothetical protein SAMN05444000_1471 [Shimia gijangensis]|uniref:Uncharacterized protein n=1 Tax=Shimia gijangensis TaxID=1470563 RepID=A0A1M6TXV6_9RHOB|nr:hypothetical protein SAMN05444000_1471 [Shimia gijangensis]